MWLWSSSSGLFYVEAFCVWWGFLFPDPTSWCLRDVFSVGEKLERERYSIGESGRDCFFCMTLLVERKENDEKR